MTGRSEDQNDHMFDDDTLHEECGVFGIFGHADAGALTVLGLHALQHRGQEAAGIVTYDNGQFIAERHIGLVGDVFGRKSDAAKNLQGPICDRPCALFHRRRLRRPQHPADVRRSGRRRHRHRP